MASSLFHRVVVPTDFSECAEEAWALAQRIGETLGSEVVLVHVFVEPPLYGDPALPVGSAWEAQRRRRRGEEARARRCRRARAGACPLR